MKDDVGAIVLLTFLIFAIGIISGASLVSYSDETRYTVSKKSVIEHGCAKYNSKDVFVWEVKDE